MKFRLAKCKDLSQIVKLHYDVRKNYQVGIFSLLDKTFLRNYYRILLKNQNFVVICAEDTFGKIQGFCSSTIDLEEQFQTLNNNKISLAFSALPSIIKNPKIIMSLISRLKSINNKGNQFISNTGARLEYWVWSKDNDDKISSLLMHETLLKILESLGIKEVNFEVDSVNKNVYKFHKFNGAIEIKRIFLEDNRERILLKYCFNNRKTKIKLYKIK